MSALVPYFELFHQALLHHINESTYLAKDKLSKRTILLKELVTFDKKFRRGLYFFIDWLVGENGLY